MSDDKIVLTGIKPTGMPHIGNYLGAFKHSIDLSQNHKTFMFIADLHALNAVHDAKIVKQHSYEAAAFMIAMGVNLENTVLFRQSDVNEIYQLTELQGEGLRKSMKEKNSLKKPEPIISA